MKRKINWKEIVVEGVKMLISGWTRGVAFWFLVSAVSPSKLDSVENLAFCFAAGFVWEMADDR